MLTFPTFQQLSSVLYLKTTTIFVKGNLFYLPTCFLFSDTKTQLQQSVQVTFQPLWNVWYWTASIPAIFGKKYFGLF